MMHDMHCHLDFIAEAESVADDARQDGTLLFANTVTPEGYSAAATRFDTFDNVRVGFGMHPWWVGERQDDAESKRATSQRAADRSRFAKSDAHDELTHAEQAQIDNAIAGLNEANPRLIGEIGLDFGWRHLETRLAQTRMFEAIVSWAAAREGKLLSIHSIKAAREALDILESCGALESCECIFHWFSGPSDLLKRAVDAGCYFSCGYRMLDTRKGREYLKAIPAKQLLLETDAPPERGAPYPYTSIRHDLAVVAAGIAEIKGDAALGTISDTSARLLA